MGETREHFVPAGDNDALIVYCASCMRVLATYPTNGIDMQTMAHANAYDHWQSYSQDHLVTVTDMRDHRFEYIQHDNQFHEGSPND